MIANPGVYLVNFGYQPQLTVSNSTTTAIFAFFLNGTPYSPPILLSTQLQIAPAPDILITQMMVSLSAIIQTTTANAKLQMISFISVVLSSPSSGINAYITMMRLQ